MAQPVLARIVRAVRWRVGVDMLGRRSGTDEQAAVVKVRPVQNLARYRVEEGLRALGLLVVDQQPDVVALDRFPPRLVDPVAAELALERRDGLGDPPIVEVDAVLRGVGDREPVAGLEMALGWAVAIAEQG